MTLKLLKMREGTNSSLLSHRILWDKSYWLLMEIPFTWTSLCILNKKHLSKRLRGHTTDFIRQFLAAMVQMTKNV